MDSKAVTAILLQRTLHWISRTNLVSGGFYSSLQAALTSRPKFTSKAVSTWPVILTWLSALTNSLYMTFTSEGAYFVQSSLVTVPSSREPLILFSQHLPNPSQHLHSDSDGSHTQSLSTVLSYSSSLNLNLTNLTTINISDRWQTPTFVMEVKPQGRSSPAKASKGSHWRLAFPPCTFTMH